MSAKSDSILVKTFLMKSKLSTILVEFSASVSKLLMFLHLNISDILIILLIFPFHIPYFKIHVQSLRLYYIFHNNNWYKDSSISFKCLSILFNVFTTYLLYSAIASKVMNV